MKKLLLGVLCVLMTVPSWAEIDWKTRRVANVEYVNQRLKNVPIKTFDLVEFNDGQYSVFEDHTFDMLFETTLSEAEQKQVASVEYLLKSVDRVNKVLNGYKATDFGESKYATNQAANVASVDAALKHLVGIYFPFSYQTVKDTSESYFLVGAAGLYWVDWGDGTVELLTKEQTNGIMEVGHVYETPGQYTVKLGGKAMAYGAMDMDMDFEKAPPAIIFGADVYKIKGSLGKIFSTLEDGTNPYYFLTFAMCENITGEIPAELFEGNTGSPSTGMFFATFADGGMLVNGDSPKVRFTGKIPEKLFSGFSGRTNWAAFSMTFMGNLGLSGSIPEKLFGNIVGEPGNFTFMYTFAMCPFLSGSIPEKLFAGVQGTPEEGILLFAGTFAYCYSLSGAIPEKLFAGITGQPGYGMFMSTFTDCVGLSGVIPGKLFAGISGEPVDMVFSGTFAGCTGLTGIGGPLFAGMSGVPYQEAYRGTFYNCSGLSGDIPDGMFGDLGCDQMYSAENPNTCWVGGSSFYETFYGCSGLNGQSATVLGPDGEYHPMYELNYNRDDYNFADMYYLDDKLEDYNSVPCVWGGGAC